MSHVVETGGNAALGLFVGWLLAVGMTGCRESPVSFSADTGAQGDRDSNLPDAAPMFQEITETSGVDFIHTAGNSGHHFMMEPMCPGVALFDYDCDGDLDLYLINGCRLGESGQPQPNPEAGPWNRLYRQETPGYFRDVTDGSGLDDPGYGMGVAIGDVNNDGYPDVYVTNFGPDQLYLNRRDGTFANITHQAGIDNNRLTASACFFDYDRDGWLDLFVTNYVNFYPKTCQGPAGTGPDYCGPHHYENTTDKLYHNELGIRPGGTQAGSGENRVPYFADVSLPSGIARKRGPGLGVVCADFNADRWPDVYVANDLTENFLWINQQDGSFRDEGLLRGCALDPLGRAQASMGIGLGDVDGDARFDLFLTHLEAENNALYLANNSSGFQESSRVAGLAEPSLPSTGFGTALGDLDHDGDLDLLVANGRIRRAPSQTASVPSSENEAGSVPEFWRPYAEPNHIYLNDGAGRFQFFHASADPFTSAVEVTRGLACGDFDNDGDWDVVIGNTAGKVRLYRNEARKSGAWLVVRAVEPQYGGRDAYGAVVTVVAGRQRWPRLIHPGGSYLSSHDPRAHFGLGDVPAIDHIEVDWPDGTSEIFPGGAVNRHIVLKHGEGQPQ